MQAATATLNMAIALQKH